jgi:hypothetical protein
VSYRAHRMSVRRAAVTSQLAALEQAEDERRMRDRDEAEDRHWRTPNAASRERLRELGGGQVDY